MAPNRSLVNVFSAGLTPRVKDANLSYVGGTGGWFGIIRESFSGAFQRNITVDTPQKILTFSAVYAAVTMIAGDISKCRLKLMTEDPETGIKTEVRNSPFLAVLKKPNRFQHRLKFFEQWVICKLLHGNSYALKVRDGRGIVVGLYLLDPTRVTPLVSDGGDIYYRLSADNIAGVPESVVAPASEIIHDMMVSLWHPLVGITPIMACAMSATQGNRIQADSTQFFGNMSRPGGILTTEQAIDEEDAKRWKRDWDDNFQGNNTGKTAVLGNGLKYEGMAVTPNDSQLIDQLEWTVRDVARAFGVPEYKIGGTLPLGANMATHLMAYYSDCLQKMFEQIEASLDDGLNLPTGYSTEFDVDAGLLRMDITTRYTTKTIATKGGWMAPDEARAGENMPPVPGGKYPLMQQQNYSLEALAKRDARADPFATAPKVGGNRAGDPPAPDDSADEDIDEKKHATFLEKLAKELIWRA